MRPSLVVVLLVAAAVGCLWSSDVLRHRVDRVRIVGFGAETMVCKTGANGISCRRGSSTPVEVDNALATALLSSGMTLLGGTVLYSARAFRCSRPRAAA